MDINSISCTYASGYSGTVEPWTFTFTTQKSSKSLQYYVGICIDSGISFYGVQLNQDATDRTRLNGGSNSFPSRHSSSATLSNRNLNSITMPEGMRMSLQLGTFYSLRVLVWHELRQAHITQQMCWPALPLGISSALLFTMPL